MKEQVDRSPRRPHTDLLMKSKVYPLGSEQFSLEKTEYSVLSYIINIICEKDW